jgi:hypothetical protein
MDITGQQLMIHFMLSNYFKRRIRVFYENADIVFTEIYSGSILLIHQKNKISEKKNNDNISV